MNQQALDQQVTNIRLGIDMNILFNTRTIDDVQHKMKSRKPGKESLNSRRLYKMVFKEVCPNYENIESRVASRAEDEIWDNATNTQKMIYSAYLEEYNKNVKIIFPEIFIKGDKGDYMVTEKTEETGPGTQ